MTVFAVFLGNEAFCQRFSSFSYQLGRNGREVSKALRNMSFKPVAVRNSEDDAFYGICKEYYYTGTFYGNPTVVKVVASHKTGTVFVIELTLRDFIDEYEAIGEGDRILADIKAHYRHIGVENDKNMSVNLIEMPGGGKRITRYLCSPICAGIIIREYDSDPSSSDAVQLSCTTVIPYQSTLGHEYLVGIRLYHNASANLARKESGKGE